MLDDRLIEELLIRDAAGATAEDANPLRRVAAISALAVVVVGLVLGALAWLLAGPLVAVVVFVVAVAALAGAAVGLVWRPADARLRAAIGGRPADPVGEARLINLVEGLCTATGLKVPTVRVIDADGLNALAAGRGASSAIVAVTTGLVSGLSRIELEGVLAAEVVAIRRERMVAPTVAASLPSPFAKLVPTRAVPDLDNDLAAVRLTRYPPGLVGAYEKMAERGTSVASPPALDPLWLVPLQPAPAGPTPARVSLAARIEALSEL